jgi:hypothetical protein
MSAAVARIVSRKHEADGKPPIGRDELLLFAAYWLVFLWLILANG